MLQIFLHPCSFFFFFPFFLPSLKRIKDPEGKWYAGFPAEPQMCWLGASLGASWARHRGRRYGRSEKGSEGLCLVGSALLGKLLFISS